MCEKGRVGNDDDDDDDDTPQIYTTNEEEKKRKRTHTHVAQNTIYTIQKTPLQDCPKTQFYTSHVSINWIDSVTHILKPKIEIVKKYDDSTIVKEYDDKRSL